MLHVVTTNAPTTSNAVAVTTAIHHIMVVVMLKRVIVGVRHTRNRMLWRRASFSSTHEAKAATTKGTPTHNTQSQWVVVVIIDIIIVAVVMVVVVIRGSSGRSYSMLRGYPIRRRRRASEAKNIGG